MYYVSQSDISKHFRMHGLYEETHRNLCGNLKDGSV